MMFYDVLKCSMMFYDVLCLKIILGFLLSKRTSGVSPVVFNSVSKSPWKPLFARKITSHQIVDENVPVVNVSDWLHYEEAFLI